MQDFFNNQINMAGMTTSEGNAIISCQVNLDKNFAFLEVSCLFLLLTAIDCQITM